MPGANLNLDRQETFYEELIPKSFESLWRNAPGRGRSESCLKGRAEVCVFKKQNIGQGDCGWSLQEETCSALGSKSSNACLYKSKETAAAPQPSKRVPRALGRQS